MKHNTDLLSISEAASYLNVSEALVQKFINMGLVKPVVRNKKIRFTGYNLRRLISAVDLYEKSYSPDTIEFMLDN